eukprot:scaffold461_cov131-Isochrysis_galbana.AAC.1
MRRGHLEPVPDKGRKLGREVVVVGAVVVDHHSACMVNIGDPPQRRGGRAIRRRHDAGVAPGRRGDVVDV